MSILGIHIIQQVPPSLMNSDETGAPKTGILGATKRLRISSQAIKSSVRKFFAESKREEYLGKRSVMLPTVVKERILKLVPDASEEKLTSFQKLILSVVEKVDEKSSSFAASKAIVFYSESQLDALATLGVGFVQGEKVSKAEVSACFSSLNSVDIALFGRMMAATGDLSVFAAADFAHAVGTTEYVEQRDSYTAYDDVAGVSKMLGSTEFVSGVMYRYAHVDINQLISNLDGNDKLAYEAVGELVRALFLSAPSGKSGSFASNVSPSLMVVTISDSSFYYSSAFDKPLHGDSVLEDSVNALVAKMEKSYQNIGAPERAFVISEFDTTTTFADNVSLAELTEAIRDIA